LTVSTLRGPVGILVLLYLLLPALAPAQEGIDLLAYDEFVSTTFGDVHRSLARQVVSDYSLDTGRVLEVAFGAPLLSIELARITALEFDVLVADSAELALGMRRVRAQQLESRFRFRCDRVEDLPYGDSTFDLVLARDALRFWPAKAAAFKEIDRVLKPGRVALLGGGIGRDWSDRDAARFWAKVQDWRNRTDPGPWARSSPYPEVLESAVADAGVPARVWTEGGYCNCRTWVEWTRATQPPTAPSEPATPPEPETDVPAPDFRLVGLAGDTVTLGNLRGRVVLLDFWGVDCRACLNIMKLVKPALAAYDTARLRVLAVNVDADRSLYEGFTEEKGNLGFEMVYDDAGVARAYNIRGLPHFVVIDSQGWIRARIKGSTAAAVDRICGAVERLTRRDE
jgi:SAM-dependent methyltransferase/peroxiredoxin